MLCYGWVAQLVEALSQYAKVVGSIPNQGIYKEQPINAWISGTTNRCFSLSFFLSLKSIKKVMLCLCLLSIWFLIALLCPFCTFFLLERLNSRYIIEFLWSVPFGWTQHIGGTSWRAMCRSRMKSWYRFTVYSLFSHGFVQVVFSHSYSSH